MLITGLIMLISLRASNFFSFAEESLVSFEIGKKPSPSSFDIRLPLDRRLNKVVAVVGPNGSGKTQLIKPLAFLSWFIGDSFLGVEPDANIPFKPHSLMSDQNTRFELVFRIRDDEFKYVLEANRNYVVHESLYKKTTQYFSYLFVRDLVLNNGEVSYEYKQQGFPFKKTQAKGIRGNASIIAAANSYDVLEARQFVEYFSTYSHNINVTGRQHFHNADLLSSAEFFYKSKSYLSKLESLLCEFDLGLSSVTINEIETKDSDGADTAFYLPFGVHKTDQTVFELPLFEESSGTQSAFVLMRRILPALEHGGVAVIDEIDNDLHPHLLPHIVDLFKFEHSNPKNAQLIFTCHTPEILNLLNKHQVYLVEKKNQRSESWRLDEVLGLRADDNLYAKYMAGALSAVPNI